MCRAKCLATILMTCSLPLLLGACGLLKPTALPTRQVAEPQLSLLETPRHVLLEQLGHCGLADSLQCAHIHFALANVYLSSGALNQITLHNAAQELEMAATNQAMVIKTLALRRIVQALLENRSALQKCNADKQRSAARLASAQARAETAQTRLQQLESLLHNHAEKSLKRPTGQTR